MSGGMLLIRNKNKIKFVVLTTTLQVLPINFLTVLLKNDREMGLRVDMQRVACEASINI